ncbi:hypothetical protein FIU90_00470 [Erythrobacter sp. THAF29]|nr:hypothetical protein FIU90_00470 [Erythrobacter sp. THAF29]
MPRKWAPAFLPGPQEQSLWGARSVATSAWSSFQFSEFRSDRLVNVDTNGPVVLSNRHYDIAVLVEQYGFLVDALLSKLGE